MTNNWTRAKIERTADEITGGVAPTDLEGIAGNFGATIRVEKLDGDVSGMLITSSKSSKKVILINKDNHENRRRFTVAHEIAHLIMHKGEDEVFVDSRGSATLYFRSKESVNQIPLAERQANEFASCILMPQKALLNYIKNNPIDINDDTSVKIMANRFGVSVQALSIRLARLKLTHQL